MHPLDGHLWKLHRAKQHLDSLYNELVVFLQPGCYQIVDEFDPEGQAIRQVLRRRITFTREPPLFHWGTMIGDYIQNVRSALDHVIFAISYSRNPDEFVDDRTTFFPVFNDPDAFRRPRRKRPPLHEIRGIPPDAKAIVEGLQPYHRGKESAGDPLWLLHEMSNIDKHRNIHLTAWAAHTIALDITQILPGARLHSLNVRPAGMIESGAILAEVDYSCPGGLAPIMQMEKNFLFTIALDEPAEVRGQPLNSVLSYIGGYVEGIVDVLDGFVVRVSNS